MEKLEKVELVREKTGVSYQDARDALDACDDDVLDAIIWLETNGKTQAQTATYETASQATRSASPEMVQAQTEYHESSKKTKVGDVWSSFRTQVKKLLRAGFDMTFIAERHGATVVSLPLIILIVGLLAWGVSLWLLIVGLFFGFRYRIEGAESVTIDVNEAMDKAADMADSIKNDFSKNE